MEDMYGLFTRLTVEHTDGENFCVILRVGQFERCVIT